MLYEGSIPSGQERNPKTYAAHKGEVFWQITLPLLMFGIIVLALCVAVVWAGSVGVGEVSRWADVSLIWLLLPWLFVALLFLAILVGLVVLAKLPPLARQAQDTLVKINSQVTRTANVMAEPIIRIHSLLASWRALRRFGGK